MSGLKYSDGERERCPLHGQGRRLSQREIKEIRRGIDIANAKARRQGIQPQDPKITVFSCTCNCFHIDVK